MGAVISGGDDDRTPAEHAAIYMEAATAAGYPIFSEVTPGDTKVSELQPEESIVMSPRQGNKPSRLRAFGIGGATIAVVFAAAAINSVGRTTYNAHKAMHREVDAAIQQGCVLNDLRGHSTTFTQVSFLNAKNDATMRLHIPHNPSSDADSADMTGDVFDDEGKKKTYSVTFNPQSLRGIGADTCKIR